jgi:hypothetical protein
MEIKCLHLSPLKTYTRVSSRRQDSRLYENSKRFCLQNLATLFLSDWFKLKFEVLFNSCIDQSFHALALSGIKLLSLHEQLITSAHVGRPKLRCFVSNSKNTCPEHLLYQRIAAVTRRKISRKQFICGGYHMLIILFDITP